MGKKRSPMCGLKLASRGSLDADQIILCVCGPFLTEYSFIGDSVKISCGRLPSPAVIVL